MTLHQKINKSAYGYYSVCGSVEDSVDYPVRDSVWGSVGDSVWGSVGDSVWDSVTNKLKTYDFTIQNK